MVSTSGSRGGQAAALFARAAECRARNDPGGAEYCLRTILTFDAGNALAHNALGNLAISTDQHRLAVEHHRRAVRAAPGEPGFRNDLANSLILFGDPAAALPHLRRALERAPTLRPAQLNLARAYRDLGDADRALALLGNLGANLKPEESAVGVGVDLERALTLLAIGEGGAARSLFRKVLAVRPDDARALDGLVTCHRATAEVHDLDIVDTALSQPGLSTRQRAVANRARGKILDDLGRYDEAFDAFRQANASSPSRFDIEAHEAFIEASISLFTPRFLAERRDHGVATERPVFIVGLPRSGTSLVEQILASHPAVVGLGELNLVEETLLSATGISAAGLPGIEKLSGLSAADVHRLAKTYLAATDARAGTALRAIDKMPHNFLVVGWIAMMFPRVRIIHCMRDPLDVCVSLYTHYFSDTHSYSRDLALLGRYYRSYERLMKHWENLVQEQMISVRYEELVGDLEEVSRRMIRHLGLDWHPACLAYHQTRRVVQTPSRWQVKQPLYSSSIGRWRRYEAHLGPLLSSLRLA